MTTADNRSTIRRKLGRGLGSLISTPVRVDVPPTTLVNPPAVQTAKASLSDVSQAKNSAPTASVPAPSPGNGLLSLPLSSITTNPRQPRQHFDEAALNALAGSIRVSGVMQPVVVRPATVAAGIARGVKFELIAGERRWRAAQIAGLTNIPAVVRDVDDRTAAEFSLVENVQREDLNPLERAEAFARLASEFHLTQSEIAERVGLDRSSISNHLRLLELDDQTKAAVRDGRLSMGHARGLLALTNNERRAVLAAEALRNEWSVRELERQVRDANAGIAGGTTGAGSGGPQAKVALAARERSDLPSPLSAHLADLQKRLGEHMGTKVHVHPGRAKGSGKLVIDFYTIDQFEGLLRRMDFEMQE